MVKGNSGDFFVVSRLILGIDWPVLFLNLFFFKDKPEKLKRKSEFVFLRRQVFLV